MGFCFSSAFAGVIDERVVLKNTFKINAVINNKTVRCSSVGYGAPELKINLVELKGKTIFDHSNARFGEFLGPCMTAGFCQGFGAQGLKIEDVIQNNPRTEKIEMEQTLTVTRSLNEQEGGGLSCVKTLKEDLKTKIAGLEFHHSRSGVVEILREEACKN